MSGKLESVQVSRATKGQLLAFAEATLQSVPVDEVRAMGAEALRTALRDAGFKDSILVAVAPPEASHPKSDSPRDNLLPRRTKPEEERWILAEWSREADNAGNYVEDEIFVGVNDDFAYVPKGFRVWIRETLFWHIDDARVVRYEEHLVPTEIGMPGKPVRRRYEDKMYHSTVHAVGGRVQDEDALPDVRPGELIIAPRHSQAAAISVRQHAEMEKRRLEAVERDRQSERAFQDKSLAEQQLVAQYAAA